MEATHTRSTRQQNRAAAVHTSTPQPGTNHGQARNRLYKQKKGHPDEAELDRKLKGTEKALHFQSLFSSRY